MNSRYNLFNLINRFLIAIKRVVLITLGRASNETSPGVRGMFLIGPLAAQIKPQDIFSQFPPLPESNIHKYGGIARRTVNCNGMNILLRDLGIVEENSVIPKFK